MATWLRNWGTLNFASALQGSLGSISAGHVLHRIHAGVQLTVRIPNETDPIIPLGIAWGVGIYITNASTGSQIQPLVTPDDVDPPTERWLWWTIMSPRPLPCAADGYGGLQAYGAACEPDPIDVKAPALAPSGNLNVWLSCQAFPAFPGGWTVSLNYWASVLSS